VLFHRGKCNVWAVTHHPFPSLLPHCFVQAVIVTPQEADIPAAKSTLLRFKGAKASQVEAYLQELPDAIKLLQKKFPERVTVLTSADAADAVASALL
jgi:hypothetical protein